jgi:hypothetical protein
MRRSKLAMAMLIACALSACAVHPGTDPSASQLARASVPGSTPDPAADDSLGQLVQAYGDAHQDEFAGVYYDQENGGRLVARFTGHLDVHQRALDDLLGSPGRVTVVSAASTQTSLQHIVDAVTGNHQELAAQGIELQTAWVDVIRNTVELQAKSDDPLAEAILQAYGPPGVVEVDIYPADKPWTQPTEGSGWRLLGAFDTHLPYTVAFAVDRPQLATEWASYELPGEPPAWDPPREVALMLSDGIGSRAVPSYASMGW